MQHKDMDVELQRFAADHPEGWGHHEWLGLLQQLSNAGYDVSDPDGIGLGIERHRLVQVLQRMEIRGLGPKRIEAVASHFGTLWNLMSASPEDLARIPSIHRGLAEQILDVLQ